MAIWYALYCPNKKEQDVILSCKQYFSAEVLRDAFVLTYDKMRRYEGAWHMEQKEMFPDYVFLESEDGAALAAGLGRYKNLLSGETGLLRVEKEEEEFLRDLCGNRHHLGMSRGVILDGVTRVLEGPLQGKENRIRKIDRHKRLARVEMPAGREFGCVPAGLEIVEKR